MSWTVQVYTALNAGLLTWFTNGAASTGGTIALRGFDPPVVVPPGISKTLNLFVRQDAALIPPRAIIKFWIGSEPVFWGPAVIVPPLNAPGAGPFDQDRDSLERVTVVGGEQLLKDSVIGPRLFEGNTDVAAIALELCQLYAHPALTVYSPNFPNAGAVLSTYYSPEKDLHSALEELAVTVPGGASFWVDASGFIHFEAN